MNTKRWTAFLPLLLGVLLAAGCYYMPPGAQGSARVSMALTKGLPGNLSSVVLIVSGPGMKTMANEYPAAASGSVSLEVPAGLARTFTLLPSTASVTFKAEATVDLAAGETKEIMLTPVLFDSQIIVPDYLNNRLVQIADMSGTGWTAIQYDKLGLGMLYNYEFAPYDVDFDDQGRIYVANYYDGVVRMNDINDTAAKWDLRGSLGVSPVSAIAIDRKNDILYIANSFSLAKIDIAAFGTAPTPTPLLNHGSTNITGLAVGPEGSLYLTSYGGGNGGFLIKYDPFSQTVLAAYPPSFPSMPSPDWDPWDVSIQNGYVYTTHVLQSGVNKIARTDLSLTPIDEYTGPASDPFYGPRRFVAILSRKLTVIDERYTGADLNRLAAFNNMAGDGWTTYGATGSSTGQFNLFNYYSGC